MIHKMSLLFVVTCLYSVSVFAGSTGEKGGGISNRDRTKLFSNANTMVVRLDKLNEGNFTENKERCRLLDRLKSDQKKIANMIAKTGAEGAQIGTRMKQINGAFSEQQSILCAKKGEVPMESTSKVIKAKIDKMKETQTALLAECKELLERAEIIAIDQVQERSVADGEKGELPEVSGKPKESSAGDAGSGK